MVSGLDADDFMAKSDMILDGGGHGLGKLLHGTAGKLSLSSCETMKRTQETIGWYIKCFIQKHAAKERAKEGLDKASSKASLPDDIRCGSRLRFPFVDAASPATASLCCEEIPKPDQPSQQWLAGGQW